MITKASHDYVVEVERKDGAAASSVVGLGRRNIFSARQETGPVECTRAIYDLYAMSMR
jgi:hypothetical protein